MKKLIFLFFLIILFAPLIVVWAQEPVAFDFPPPESTDIAGYINSFYNTAVLIAGIVAVAMIVIGAIYYTVSGGSQDKQREGKDIITSAIWGVVLLLGAYVILNTINPELINLSLPGGPAPFCKQPVDPRDPCTPEQESDPEAHGCCISQSALVEQGLITCPQEVTQDCGNVTVTEGDLDPDPDKDYKTVWMLYNAAWPDRWMSTRCEKIKIYEGGQYNMWAYYPENGSSTIAETELIDGFPVPKKDETGAACIIYSYKQKPGDKWSTNCKNNWDHLRKC